MGEKLEDSIRKFKEFFFSSQGFPLFLVFTLLGFLFVLFRMKGVDVDYKRNEVKQDISKASLINKQLKAKKAKKLSTKSLRKMAKEHKLSPPSQDQIIVVP